MQAAASVSVLLLDPSLDPTYKNTSARVTGACPVTTDLTM